MENNQIIYFLEHIYKNCNNLGVKPNIIMQWIEDLLLSFHDLNTESDKDSVYNDTKGSAMNETVEKNKNEQNSRREIPFVSSVSSYIKQKKKKIKHLENIKNTLSKGIDDLTEQRKEKTSKLNKTIGLEKKVFSYFSWNENLKQELFYEHDLLIEQALEYLQTQLMILSNTILM